MKVRNRSYRGTSHQNAQAGESHPSTHRQVRHKTRVRHRLERAVEVACGDLPVLVRVMERSQDLNRRCTVWIKRRRRPKAESKQLSPRKRLARAVAEPEGDLMKSIGMDDREGGRAGQAALTAFADGVAELDNEAELAQRRRDKPTALPLLTRTLGQLWASSSHTHLNRVKGLLLVRADNAHRAAQDASEAVPASERADGTVAVRMEAGAQTAGSTAAALQPHKFLAVLVAEGEEGKHGMVLNRRQY
jgi:hypothetical protein